MLYSSLLQRNFLGEHVSPILLLLTPVYGLFPSAKALLIAQSFALAASAIPIYWLAKEKLESRAALVLLVVYFFNQAILGAAFFDFHEIAFAVPLLAFGLYYCEHERDVPFVLTLLGAMLCKEEVALIVAAFGVYIWIRRGKSSLAVSLIAIGLLVFLIDYNVVLPYFRGRPGPYADRYSYLGVSIPGMLWNLIRHPIYVVAHIFTLAKLGYLCVLFGSVAFLPLLTPVHLIPILPTFLRILLSGLAPEFSLEFHYSALMTPFLFGASIYSIESLTKNLSVSVSYDQVNQKLSYWSKRFTLLHRQIPYVSLQDLLVTVVLVAGGAFGMNPLRYLKSPKPGTDIASFAEIRNRLPADASLAGDDTLVAHLAHRRNLSFLPIVNNADFVMMDLADDRYEYPLNREEHRRMALRLGLEQGYAAKSNEHGVLLMQRGGSQSAAEFAAIVAPIFFHYSGMAVQSRRCHRCAAGYGRIFFTRARPYPPGRYNVAITVEGESGSNPSMFDVHAIDHAKEHEDRFNESKSLLGEKLTLAARDSNESTFEFSFENPTWNEIKFRLLTPDGSDLKLKAVDVQPEQPTLRVLRELKDY
ncbi:MAG TPA: DUF2079 domain-containing protein [Candidatus Binataceae bacterium]|nr:DUF2079 domain-containing protein [Candidatus Binataceae bacterium]